MEKSIGIFDSGIGGLTVVRSVIEKLPNENLIYFGDLKNMPYGDKSEKEIENCIRNDLAFLRRFDLKAIVVACNTADAIGRKRVLKDLDLPLLGVVLPACEKAVKNSPRKKIGLLATAATVSSGAYEKTLKELAGEIELTSKACPLLTPLIEEGHFRKGDPLLELVLDEYLEPFNDIDTLILGCTHYSLISDSIKEKLPGVRIISSSDACAEALSEKLEQEGLLATKQKAVRKYYVSDRLDKFKMNAGLFLADEAIKEAELV